MASVGTVISYPIPVYSNLPIESQFYQPSRFVISSISTGSSTTITATEDMNYVVGQMVRLLIPVLYGAQQLNGVSALVTSIPSSTQVTLDLDSSFSNAFISNPLTATITNATQANLCVLTATNSFKVGNFVTISGVGGMTQLNGNTYQIRTCTSSSITLNVDSTNFSAYTSGGTATLVTTDKNVPQIIAIGDVNTGVINSNGSSNTGTYINGSFINISPA